MFPKAGSQLLPHYMYMPSRYGNLPAPVFPGVSHTRVLMSYEVLHVRQYKRLRLHRAIHVHVLLKNILPFPHTTATLATCTREGEKQIHLSLAHAICPPPPLTTITTTRHKLQCQLTLGFRRKLTPSFSQLVFQLRVGKIYVHVLCSHAWLITIQVILTVIQDALAVGGGVQQVIYMV